VIPRGLAVKSTVRFKLDAVAADRALFVFASCLAPGPPAGCGWVRGNYFVFDQEGPGGTEPDQQMTDSGVEGKFEKIQKEQTFRINALCPPWRPPAFRDQCHWDVAGRQAFVMQVTASQNAPIFVL
jgi:hypothetical protein